MTEIYRVLHIWEDDFGCEERPADQPRQVLVVLRDKCGMEQTIRQADDWLYEQNINEGDAVSFLDGTLRRALTEKRS